MDLKYNKVEFYSSVIYMYVYLAGRNQIHMPTINFNEIHV